MVIIKYLLLFLLCSPNVYAASQSLTEASAKSSALRKERKFREDAILNQQLIKDHFKDEHSKLTRAVKNNESIDSVSPELQRLYLLIYSDYSLLIRHQKSPSEQLFKDQKKFLGYYQLLDGLEIKPRQVNSINDKVTAHIASLKGSVYKTSRSFYLQYISWQEKSQLSNVTLGTNEKLLITNKGFCLGGDYGIENEKYHFYVDGCALLGSGTVSGVYNQASLPFFGAKIAPGASLISSSSKSRVGLKLPFLYSSQTISDFEANGSAYVVKKKDNFFISSALYSRWYFKQFYVDLELGKFIMQPEAYWGLGFGWSL